MLFHRYFTYVHTIISRTERPNFSKRGAFDGESKVLSRSILQQKIFHISIYVRKTTLFHIIKPKISTPNVSSYCLSIRYVHTTYEKNEESLVKKASPFIDSTLK